MDPLDRRLAALSDKSDSAQHGHGDEDPVVEYQWGKKTIDTLKELGFSDITFKTYPGTCLLLERARAGWWT